MKVGDLISFKPTGFAKDDWSAPGIVLELVDDSRDAKLWIVWCEGINCVIAEEIYDVLYLTTSSQVPP